MNTFGNNFRLSIYGESHGPVIGIVLDGVRPGLELSEDSFTEDLGRRRPGAEGTTARVEPDPVKILSGVYRGHTTGAPLCIEIPNLDVCSAPYEGISQHPRPGHADLTAALKFGGFNDPRGGGHFSGRLSAALVAAAVVAKKMLPGYAFEAKVVEVGGLKENWGSAIEAARSEGDSLGGIVECRVKGVPAGLGEPFWDSVESLVAHAVFAIPGVRGIEFGDGFAAAAKKGSEHNDIIGPDGSLQSNHAGGINGGISNGQDLLFRVAFKPASSIAKAGIPGRHDACFVLRTPVIVEAAAAIVFAGLQK